MVYKDVAEDGELRVEGGDLPNIGFEGGAKSLEGRGGVELRDFVLDLLRNELALEVWREWMLASFPLFWITSKMMGGLQCSCFPVRDWPGGGIDMLLFERRGSSLVTGAWAGSTAAPFCGCSWDVEAISVVSVLFRVV